ncbi:uncharacterized protein B0H18DRAFT_878001 [Fomitopsis serialis]|uniref:uncharacterized protein n=1 Tax=Fomitopsis serialis TaxID=139415 RepID=UPI002008C7EE|nr:uncharacterized protein B0H18DRAFT_878001 [Neoantrodia serialis]KAH9924416.1 hypothetical protein B0H18DRAFT_878001 [Neoantrodia serialis]
MTCREWIVFESVSSLILELSVQLLLILRLFAMYLGSKTTMRVMMVPFVIQAIVMAVCIGMSVPRFLVSPNCVEATVPLELVIYCIVSIMFESFLFSLTISRYRHAKRDGMANLGLLTVLVRDGMLAFAVIFGKLTSC